MKGLKQFLSTILVFVMCFSFCFSAISEVADAEEKAKEIFEGLAKSYNSALSYLESLQKLMDKNNDKQFPALEDPNAHWFYNYLDILDNTIVFSRLFSYAREVRPEIEDPDTNFIYDTLIVPVYEKYNKYGQTDDGVISTLITINDLIWEDEKAQEHLEEQKQALRQFKKDFPDYELLSDLQNMYKVTFSIVDYSYNERIGTTEYSFGNKIREYQDIKRDLQGSFDLYFDWPDSIYPGSQETYRDFYVSYWKEKEAENAAKEEALRQAEAAEKEARGSLVIQKDEAHLAIHTYENASGFTITDDGLICIRENRPTSYYGVIDTSGKLILPFREGFLSPLGNGLFALKNGEQYRLFDRNDKEILTFDVDPYALYGPHLSEGFIAIETSNGENYYIDNSGKKYPVDYAKIGNFKNGYAVVQDSYGDWGLINYKMEIVLPCSSEYKELFPFNSKSIGIAWLREDGWYYLINLEGKLISEQGYKLIKSITTDNGEYFLVTSKEDLNGVLDSDGNVLIPCEYISNNISVFRICDNGLVAVWDNSAITAFINTKGETVLSGRWEYLYEDWENGFAVLTDADTGEKYVIDMEGHKYDLFKIYEESSCLDYAFNGMFITSGKMADKDGELKTYHTLHDTNGKILLGKCDEILYKNGLILVFRDNYLTILDEDLNTIF